MPEQLGRYRISKHLATGGMAEVFLATASGIEGFQRHVVVKRIHREHARNAQFVSMFLDEARLAASLHHHNIIQVNDIGQDDGEYFYAMEYVHGEDLRALLRAVLQRKELVPLEHVVSIVIGAAAGLHYAHEHKGPDKRPLGIVHRDVSPSNIIVDYDGNVKVVDFGIAKAAQRTNQTKSGVLKGKVAYMSPEQCRGKAVDRRSDVYALGIVLYELTTARRLFKGDSDFETMSAIVAGTIPPPSQRRADLPPELEDIILKSLGKEPADRYATALELRLALEEFAANAGLRTSSTALATYMKSLFGEKPEPWLVDEFLPPEDLCEDFDGSGSGLAGVSDSGLKDFVAGHTPSHESSPLVRARQRAAARGEPVPDDPELVSSRGSGTPMAWSPGTPSQVSVVKPRAPWMMTLVASTLVAAGVALITTKPWASKATPVTPAAAQQPTVMPAAAPAAAATPTPPPAPTPAPPAQATAQPPEQVVAPVASPAAAKHQTPPKTTKTTKTTKTAKKTTDANAPGSAAGSGSSWNPDTLLPD